MSTNERCQRLWEGLSAAERSTAGQTVKTASKNVGAGLLVAGAFAIVSACASTKPPQPRTAPVPGSSFSHTEEPSFHRPYKADATNFLYNLLFCDDLALFRPKDSRPLMGALAVLLSSTPRMEDIERIAKDEKEESRVRLLAFNYLRSKNASVPVGLVLGVVVEFPLDGGLDTLAVFADGRMRYINHSEKVALFEVTPAVMKGEREKLMQASAEAVGKIGPWDKPRRPPPVKGDVRLTFLVSDGLYFGEGSFAAIQQDPIGGPVLLRASELLIKIVDEAAK